MAAAAPIACPLSQKQNHPTKNARTWVKHSSTPFITQHSSFTQPGSTIALLPSLPPSRSRRAPRLASFSLPVTVVSPVPPPPSEGSMVVRLPPCMNIKYKLSPPSPPPETMPSGRQAKICIIHRINPPFGGERRSPQHVTAPNLTPLPAIVPNHHFSHRSQLSV